MRVAVIGAGSIGGRHARDLREAGHEVLCYDVQRARSDVESPADLWAWAPEAAVICTPPAQHLEWAQLAAQHGCHLFVEKPLALSTVGWQDLASRCDRDRLVNHVACPLRYVPELRQPRELLGLRIDAGYYLPDVRADYRSAYYGETGVLLDIGSHAVDLAQWWRGPAQIVYVKTWPAGAIGLPDCDGGAVLRLEHGRGIDTEIRLDWITPVARQWRIGFYGEDGISEWEMPDHIDGAYQAEMQAFLDCCANGTPVENPITNALTTLALLLEARA